MTQENDLIKIYTGRDVLVHILQDELESAGIGSMIRDDFYAGALAGFGGTPDVVDLFVLSENEKAAQPIVEAFIANNQDE
jgi:hypothetical protein